MRQLGGKHTNSVLAVHQTKGIKPTSTRKLAIFKLFVLAVSVVIQEKLRSNQANFYYLGQGQFAGPERMQRGRFAVLLLLTGNTTRTSATSCRHPFPGWHVLLIATPGLLCIQLHCVFTFVAG